MSKNWASTLRLPKSTFPYKLRAARYHYSDTFPSRPRPLPQHRDQYIKRSTDEFYKWQATHRPADDTFVLHDGPPYANGSLHAGHALNKILKDIIIRVKVQQGRQVSYIPGWDCHGLPIELKAVSAAEGKHMTAGAIRAAARDLASKTVVEQMQSFRTYGVMADWDQRWTTMDMDFEIRQLRLFQQMASRGLIYRKYKPVYWSPSSGTALAEAELEYNENHLSRAAYVRFPIASDYSQLPGMEGFSGQLFALIWTTTPWTLPANRAIAVREDLTYHIVRTGDDAVLAAESCLERLARLLVGEGNTPEILGTVQGSQLTQLQYTNALRGKSAPAQPIINAPFVTADSGSGLVHCAPGHGFDDYVTCSALGIPVSAPVDNDGLFTDEAYPDDPERLRGISVLQSGGATVLGLLGDNVLDVHEYQHKYPYDWRTKQPIIIRATAQWFADVGSIKEAALKALDEVHFVPEAGKKRLEAFVKGRSEWCISRQRAWGVPIPALFDTSGNAVMTDETIEHIISVIQKRGTDAWWTDDKYDPVWIPASLGSPVEYTRGRDTMDVWFDSGSSWTQLGRQADLYLEGSDQHRGWFQSSLLTRVAAMVGLPPPPGTTSLGLAPFKTLVTHGFTLDKDGKKMSKSLGNIISADQVMDGSLLPPLKVKKKGGNAAVVRDALGPDALRLWVAGSDYTRDIVLGEPVLKAIHQSLIKYRTTIKMLIGSMHESARSTRLTVLDHIAIIQLKDVMAEVATAYDKHEFNKVSSSLNRWIANDLSAFYLEALKDRLYCADGGGVLEPIFMGFSRMLAPITPVLVEEAWEYRPEWLQRDASVIHPLKQLYSAPIIDPSRLTHDETALRAAIPVLMSAHSAIKAASEPARASKVLGSSLQCSVVLEVPEGEALKSLEAYADELEAMFVVSSVEINGAVPECAWKYSEVFEVGEVRCTAWVLPPKQDKCPRCWRYVAPKEDALCGRCEEVVGDGVD
ncbi:tRNA synthetases class I-domain-containing protein [Lasiosphaeris hirsuta]|uniref:Isoleucine--tRNA ligase, mitochondrial n=1 Tax=Lasiosphaeris hirsuta TaxID=260670 RepID=A0AA40BCS8_9PEZI|nr:tRNA synthetases class I-domain-containing protein [Lasiosphaeris hirsuta]